LLDAFLKIAPTNIVYPVPKDKNLVAGFKREPRLKIVSSTFATGVRHHLVKKVFKFESLNTKH